ncbi:MAG: hypothetical protein Q4P66_03780 [Actinomycetaceae bacterium]|nr:hypothetical protein [Actinomycetaceae bacterium]
MGHNERLERARNVLSSLCRHMGIEQGNPHIGSAVYQQNFPNGKEVVSSDSRSAHLCGNRTAVKKSVLPGGGVVLPGVRPVDSASAGISGCTKKVPRFSYMPGAYVISEWHQLMALISEVMGNNAWCGVAGLPQLGWLAVHEAGVDLSRVIAVPHINSSHGKIVSLLLDSCEMTVVGNVSLQPRHQRQLAAKARSRKVVLASIYPWSGARSIFAADDGTAAGALSSGACSNSPALYAV